MSITISLYLWWLWPYLALGVVLWLPLSYLAVRQVHPRRTFPQSLKHWWSINTKCYILKSVVVQVVAWPLAVTEALKGRAA